MGSFNILEGSFDGFCSLINLKPEVPSRALTYPTLGKGNNIFKSALVVDMLVIWRVLTLIVVSVAISTHIHTMLKKTIICGCFCW